MNINLRNCCQPLAGLILLALLGGCGGSIRPPATVPVKGIVHSKGKPAPGIRVKFHAQFDIGRIKFEPLGETGPDGGFTLSTGSANNGAPKGEYIVTFERPVIAPANTTNYIDTEIDAFGGLYGDPAKSEFKVTIKAGENSLHLLS